ncbi:uracil-DNA glycosylase [Roseivirga sp. UBA1976]|uniref:uracil-DNA glycosylase n=1 Tax=Roseivirga sp. UBA1976 TaxID=1947386 RepID=UPI00257DBFC5|nr:uracil-DNA glycosylase [Roseivirga sp. UBA1976]MEC7754796.1 uracil-DNA glycosylase [Bacteroidota bacterium]|tara:strand:- start:145 stop:807 length:663 start_codon:yes stop_codon:yes gene_type:complete
MTVKIEESWGRVLSPEFEKDYFRELTDFVKSEYATHTIYPKGKDIFRAFDACPFNDVKVVILGQDPYHGPGQANGLCFSVHEGVTFPPSLVNIFKEIRNDLGKEIPPNGSLERWARQGVLLLNATLTVRAHQAGSHQNKGWETFTDAVVKALASQKKGLVYMLWGSYAQKKAAIVSANENLVLKSPHPSPLSAHRGFFGCGHFSQANRYLEEKGFGQIEW